MMITLEIILIMMHTLLAATILSHFSTVLRIVWLNIIDRSDIAPLLNEMVLWFPDIRAECVIDFEKNEPMTKQDSNLWKMKHNWWSLGRCLEPPLYMYRSIQIFTSEIFVLFTHWLCLQFRLFQWQATMVETVIFSYRSTVSLPLTLMKMIMMIGRKGNGSCQLWIWNEVETTWLNQTSRLVHVRIFQEWKISSHPLHHSASRIHLKTWSSDVIHLTSTQPII